MLHQPTGTPSAYPITPGGTARPQSARNADSRLPSAPYPADVARWVAEELISTPAAPR